MKIPADFQLDEDLSSTMARLSTFIYKHGDERSKARAMLCCIFFEAIHDDFYRVRTSRHLSHHLTVEEGKSTDVTHILGGVVCTASPVGIDTNGSKNAWSAREMSRGQRTMPSLKPTLGSLV